MSPNTWRNHRKQPHVWQKSDLYLLHGNASTHQSQLVKLFLTKICTNMLLHSPYSPDKVPCDFNLFSSMRKKTETRNLCHLKIWRQHRIEPCRRLWKMVSSSAFRIYWNTGKSASSSKVTTLKVGVFRRRKLFWTKNFTPCPRAFGFYFAYRDQSYTEQTMRKLHTISMCKFSSHLKN